MSFTPVQRRDLTLVAVLRGVSYLGDSIALIALYLRLSHGSRASWAIAALSIAAALPLVLLVFVIGFYPNSVFSVMHVSVSNLIQHMHAKAGSAPAVAQALGTIFAK